jgi:hypothetical protein
MKLEKRQVTSGKTKNQIALLKAVHQSDQETGQAWVIDPKEVNQYGVYQ